MITLRQLPLFLILLRASLAPVMLALLLASNPRPVFAICLMIALLSDIFDGILARRLGIATENLRRMDSIADSIFYVAALICVWFFNNEAITTHVFGISILIALEIARYVFDFIKFGKEASYHMWTSKIWGLILFSGFFSMLVFKQNSWIVNATIYWGILADLEGLLISFLLPAWATDIPTVFHLRRKIYQNID